MQAEVTVLAGECSNDLEAAEPIMKEVEAALNSPDRDSLGKLKRSHSPPAEVVQVVSACIVLTAPGGNIPMVSCGCDYDDVVHRLLVFRICCKSEQPSTPHPSCHLSSSAIQAVMHVALHSK